MVVDPYRLSIYNETKEYYKDYPSFKSIKYSNFEPINLYKNYNSTKITFVNSDMIEEACKKKLEGNNPLMLNMSAWKIAGGGVELGCPAQEEECFRRSNYFKTLTQDLYPLGLLDTIYSPNVEFYRKGYDTKYEFMENPVKIDMVAAPAVCYPELSHDKKMFASKEDILVMEYKIHMLVQVAIRNNNNILVLSAWGCGAFECPPYHMAKIFKKILLEYDGIFEEIIFSILGTNYYLFKNSYDE